MGVTYRGPCVEAFRENIPDTLFVDWDETVTYQSKVPISQDAKDSLAIMQDRAKHGYFVITGRPIDYMYHRFEENGLDFEAFSSENGGVVVFSGGEMVYHENGKCARKLRERIMKDYENGLGKGLYLMDGSCGEVFQPCDLEDKKTMVTLNFHPINFARGVENFSGYHESSMDMDISKARVFKYMKQMVDELGIGDQGYFQFHGDSVEFVPNGISKEHARSVISKKFGIDLKKSAAVGDNYSADWPMMQGVGLPITFKEADKKLMDQVISSGGLVLEHKYGKGMKEICKELGMIDDYELGDD